MKPVVLLKMYAKGRRYFYDESLVGADLRGVDLRDANFCSTDFRGTNLSYANLRGVNFCCANLHGANLCYADLHGANLRNTNLCYANLCGANLQDAKLPSSTMVLQANWEKVSDILTRDLMRYDAACHPKGGRAFSEWAWAAGGRCPYDDCIVERAAKFVEHRALWSPGSSRRPYDLMKDVLAEKCPDWDTE